MSDIIAAEKARESVLSPVERDIGNAFWPLHGSHLCRCGVGGDERARRITHHVHRRARLQSGVGLVDAMMYLVRTATDRARSQAFMRAVQTAGDASTGRTLVERRLRERFALRISADLFSAAEIEALRAYCCPAAGCGATTAGARRPARRSRHIFDRGRLDAACRAALSRGR